jgi:glucokinase
MKRIVGIDMGGTKIQAGLVEAGVILSQQYVPVNNGGSQEAVLETLFYAIDAVIDGNTAGIGIGVPALVQLDCGVVFDMQNIPSWKEVPLKEILEARYGLPAMINNDANCFAMGERIYGDGRQIDHFVGVTLGTGMGTGLIMNGQLASGAHCGAGEFGSIPYRDSTLESYCSGKFFQKRSGQDGLTLKSQALAGDSEAKRIFSEFGDHLAHGLMILLYALDPQAVILGGSISRDFALYEGSLRARLADFPYRRLVEDLKVLPSRLENSAVLGASALFGA